MSEHVTEKAKPAPMPRSASRTAARLAAVQALYQMDMAGADANQVIGEFLEYAVDPFRGDSRAGIRDLQFADVVVYRG